MTKTEQNRVLAWRLKVLREASAAPRNVARTCRHFGLSRKAFYKWKARYEAQVCLKSCQRKFSMPARLSAFRHTSVLAVPSGFPA